MLGKIFSNRRAIVLVAILRRRLFIASNLKTSCQSNGHKTEQLGKFCFLNVIPAQLCGITKLAYIDIIHSIKAKTKFKYIEFMH